MRYVVTFASAAKKCTLTRHINDETMPIERWRKFYLRRYPDMTDWQVEQDTELNTVTCEDLVALTAKTSIADAVEVEMAQPDIFALLEEDDIDADALLEACISNIENEYQDSTTYSINMQKRILKPSFIIDMIFAPKLQGFKVNRQYAMLAKTEIERALDAIGQKSHQAHIATPEGLMKMTFFTGSRENGYQIGVCFVRLELNGKKFTRSYGHIKEILEDYKNKPIAQLSEIFGK